MIVFYALNEKKGKIGYDSDRQSTMHDFQE